MTGLAFAVGFALACWLLTGAAVAYALWRYAWLPYRSLSASLRALDVKLESGLSEMRGLVARDRVMALDDAEVAHRERRANARAQARAGRLVGEPGATA